MHRVSAGAGSYNHIRGWQWTKSTALVCRCVEFAQSVAITDLVVVERYPMHHERRSGAREICHDKSWRCLKWLVVVSGGDLTFEAAITKLMFLLSQSEDGDWVKKQMGTNLRGEITV